MHRTSEVEPYQVISTGSLNLDYAMGVGGLVEGRLTEYWGIPGCGKTTMALIAAGNAQRKYPDRVVVFIDMEQALDKSWARALGVDLDLMYHIEPDSAEDVSDIMKKALETGLISLIILDSIGGMITEVEQQKDADESAMGKLAGVITRMTKMTAVSSRKQKAAILFINQVRANLSYGSDVTTGGGFALKHATTHKVQFKRTNQPPVVIKTDEGDEQVGIEVAAKVERNKVSPPGKTAKFWLFNQPTEEFGPLGVDQADEALRIGERMGAIERSGAWFTVKGERFQGRLAMLAYLRQNMGLVDEIRTLAIDSLAADVVPDLVPKVVVR